MTDLRQKHKPDGLFKKHFVDVLSGKALEEKSFMEIVPFVLFVSAVMVFYIHNSYRAESYVREISALERELKDLRSEYITRKSQLMFYGKQTEVQKLVADQGLQKSSVPPIVIRQAN
jgi:hypothetical protein